jgi:hypothetical protein
MGCASTNDEGPRLTAPVAELVIELNTETHVARRIV